MKLVFTSLATLLMVPVAFSQKLTPSQIYEKRRDAVVQIEVSTPEGRVTGTGFFYDNKGTIATCYHVVKGATFITIRGTRNRRWYPALISLNEAGDTALLHLGYSEKQEPIPHAPSQSVNVGNEVIVIGNPLGLEGSLSTGVVAAKRNIGYLPLVQITAPISKGSSGSPVLDMFGRVIGMASFTFTRGQNLNMAVGSKILHEVLQVTPMTMQDGYKLFAPPLQPIPPRLDPITGNPIKEEPPGELPTPVGPEEPYKKLFTVEGLTDILPTFDFIPSAIQSSYHRQTSSLYTHCLQGSR